MKYTLSCGNFMNTYPYRPFPFDNDPCKKEYNNCLLYTSDAADDMQCVDLGGRRIIKK